MNSPTMASIPGSSGGRPETVTPKTTSAGGSVAAEHERVGSLDQRVERDLVSAGRPLEADGLRLAQKAAHSVFAAIGRGRRNQGQGTSAR